MIGQRFLIQQYLFPVIIGLFGVVILVNLGIWQLNRLSWKESIITQIDQKIGDLPVSIPINYSPEIDNYLPVVSRGVIGNEFILYLTSQKFKGPGYRVISPFQFENRRVLVDRGFVLVDRAEEIKSPGEVEVLGNLHWPNEKDPWFTPEPEGRLWFAREVSEIAKVLGTEPLLVIIDSISVQEDNIEPLKVTSEGIPNNHLEYAITWFGLAIVWCVMTFFWLGLNLRKRK